MNLRRLLGPGGPVAQNMPGYEHRPQQIEVAITIQEALKTKSHCLAEAGTGVGKSMAYIIPAAEHALKGNKVIISSHTIYLQSQLVSKDIPFVQKAIPNMPFTAVLMKGRGNYLCLNNFDIETPQLLLISDPS
ncbi:MAG: helicase, partial [Armatimonadota bacterium]|nr:helicase [Armatimonadota bacterium]